MSIRAPYDRRWYDLALLQMLAECYLDGIDDLERRPVVTRRLLLGNNDLRDPVLVNGQPQPNQLLQRYGLSGTEDPTAIAILPGATRLTASQARYLLDRWQILDHVPNDPSGFSATLLRERSTGQLTLAFRSTEYFPQNRGGDRERDIGGLFGAVSPLLDPAGAGPEIAFHGFALGQLAAAERYYERLRLGQLHVGGYNAEVASWFASAGNKIDLSGYSLGGHIALAMTEMHYDEIGRTHLFNAAGRGEISDAIAGAGAPGGVALARLLELFGLLVADPDAYLTSPAFLPDVRADIGRAILSDTLITLPPIAPFFGPIRVPNSYRQLYEAAKAEAAPDPGRANLYQSDRYQWAAFALGLFTRGAAWATLAGPAGWGSSTIADPANKITYLFGNGSHNDDSWVANSGRVPTGSRSWIFVEDQPDGIDSGSYDPTQEVPYLENDFGRTHSLTLIVDSLALANLIDDIDPSLLRSGAGQNAIDAVFAAASNSRAPHAGWLSGLEGIFDQRLAGNPDYARTAVEADSLERVLDALWALLRDENGDATPLAIDTSPHGFGHLINREQFHERIAAVRDRLATTGAAGTLELKPLVQIAWEDSTPAAKRILPGISAPRAYRAAFTAFPESAQAIADKAAQDTAEGYAYRYALLALNPFVLLGFDYEGSYLNAEGALDLRKTSGGIEYDQYTPTYLADRARLLLERLRRNVEDAGYLVAADGQSELLEDLWLPPRALSAVSDPVAVLVGLEAQARLREIDDLGNAERNEEAARRMVQLVREGKATRTSFGAEGGDTLTGGSLADHLFGGAGDDTLEGRDGDDYLEAGAGIDRLVGDDGDDTLFALDGEPNDTLEGGRGFDTYYADFGDRIVDTPGDPRAGVVHAGAGKTTLAGGSRTPDEAYFTGSDGFTYWLSGTGAIYVYAGAADAAARGDPLVIAAPTAPVPGHETITLGDGTAAEILGRPDLGVPLETRHNRRPTPRIPATFADKVLRAQTWIPRIDPLALDLDGDGFATIGNIGESTVRFDHDGNGVRNGTGWLGGDDDAWLALDRDGDGLVGRGAELFGIDTPLAGGGFARDGFEALAALDTNGDRVVDAYDRAYEAWQIARDADGDGVIGRGETGGARFADLRLWRDANGNGVSEPFELRTLAEAGIVALSVTAVADGRALQGGNVLRSTGTFVREDGSRGVAGALDLSRHPFFRDYERPPAFDPAVQGLPNVRGSGRVRDLVEAAAGSAELRSALAAAASAPTRAAQWGAIDAVIERWAATSDLPTSTMAFHARPDAPIVMFPFSGITATSVQAAFGAATSGQGFASGVTPADLPPDWYLAQQPAAYRERVAKVEAIEAFYGQQIVAPNAPSFEVYAEWVPQGPGQPSKRHEIRAVSAPVDAVRWEFLEQAHSILKEAVYGAIALQTRLAPYLDAIGDGPQPFAAAEALLAARRAADPIEGFADAVELARYAGVELVERGWTNLALLVDRWAREAQGDAVTRQALADLRVRTRDDLYLTGGPLGDTLLGSAWTPNFWTAAIPTIRGEEGNDVILGGANDHYLFGGPGADVIYGGPGTEIVAGGAGRDVYLFGRGSGIDQAGFDPTSGLGTLGPADRDVVRMLDGVSPSDVLVRRYQTYDGGGMTGDGLHMAVRGTDDAFLDPYFFIGDRTDADNRYVDEVRFADGTIWTVATLRLLAIEGTEGDDGASAGTRELRGYEDSDDVIDGRGGNDVILGRGGDDVLHGGTGDDRLWGGQGDDRLFGGPGSDRLDGGAGTDYLDGGPGEDYIVGGYGVDMIRFGRDSGRDWLQDSADERDRAGGLQPGLADADIVALDPDVAPEDVRALHLRDPLGGEYLRVWIDGTDAELIDTGFGRNDVGYFSANVSSIGELRFASGEVWDHEALQARSLAGGAADERIAGYDGRDDLIAGRGGNDELLGLSGDDVLLGGDGDDTLRGGPGADRLQGGPGTDWLAGGPGRDVYVWARGEEGTRVAPAGYGETLAEDVIEVGTGLRLDALVAYLVPFDFPDALVVGDPETSDWLLVPGADASLAPARLPGLTFVTATDAWTWGELGARLQVPTAGPDRLRYTGFDDTVGAGDGDDEIDGGAGQDQLYGESGADTLSGGAGDDGLWGGAGDDVLVGGSGDDELDGGAGSDLYLFARGFGRDRLYEIGAGAGETDIVRLIDVASTEVRVYGGTFGHLTVQGTGDSIEFASGAWRIERFEFADGVVARPVVALDPGGRTVRAREGEAFSYALPANAFADGDGAGTLAYSSALDTGEPLPAGLAFDPLSRTISGAPVGVTPGYADVVITATDPLGFSAGHAVRLLLLGPNTPPTVSGAIGAQAALEDAFFTLAVPANLFVENDPYDVLAFGATRADGSALPQWLRFDPFARRFSGTPRNEDVGALEIRVTARDYSDATVSTTFSLTVVNTNDPPVVLAAVPARRVNAGEPVQFAGPAFADVDAGDALALAATRSDGTALPAWLVFDPAVGRFSGVPGAADVARLSIRVTATDGAGAVAASGFSLRVDATDGTWFAQDDVASVNEDGMLELAQAALVANDTGTDASRALSVVGVDDAVNGTVTLDGRGIIRFTPFADFHGSAGFDYTAADGRGGRSIGRVEVAVAPVPDAPRVAVPIPAQVAREDAWFSMAVPAATFVDPDGPGPLTLAATLADGSPLPRWLAFAPPTRTFSGVPRHLDGGVHLVRVAATDATGETGHADFVLTVELASLVGTDRDDVIIGDTTANRLYGLAGDDRLDGGAGADQMFGGPGDDTYVVDRPSDTISELAGEGFDRVESVVTFTLPAHVEQLALMGAGAVAGYGNALNNVLIGNAAANTLSGLAGDDVLDGGAGDDTLYGGDSITGAGNDTYRFGRGGGRDRIVDYDTTPGNLDRIELAGDLTTSDVRPRRADFDLQLLTPDPATRLTVANWFQSPAWRVERVDFASGLSWDADRLARAPRFGEPGINDTIYVQSIGDDHFLFGRGFGRDTIVENQYGYAQGGFDTLTFEPGIVPGDVVRQRVDYDLILSLGDATDQLTLKNWFLNPVYETELVVFADGTEWGRGFLAKSPRFGSPGVDDTIYVQSIGDDYFLFGRGFGRDTIVENQYGHAQGGFDTVVMTPGVRATEVSLSRTAHDLVLSIAGTTDRLTLKNWFLNPVYEVERVEFANGRVWNADYLRALGAIPNRAPTLTATLPDQQAAEGAPFRFVLPAGAFADEDPGDVLTLSASLEGGGPLPAWLAFQPGAQAFEGLPGRGDSGTLRIEVRAIDDAGAAAAGVFEVVVAPSNRPPVLRGLTAAIDEDMPLDLSRQTVLATAEDADGDPLALVRVWNAVNGTVSLDAQQTIVFLPEPDYAGPARFEYAVSDGAAETAGTAWIDVRPVNDPPVAHAALLEPQTAIEDMPFQYKFPAHLFTDVDAIEPLRLTVGLADGSPLPAWLAFDEVANELAGTPGYADGGAFRLHVGANDGQATASAEFVLTVVTRSIVGSSANNRLVGTAAADKLVGLAGADTLDGRGGADTMIGGPGNDTYHVDDPGDRVIEAPGEGTDRVIATIDYALPASVENLTLAGAAATGIGNALANTLVGNALANDLGGGEGDDTLNGGPGADRMAGGSGNDRYYVDDPGDLVVEAPDEGIDRVFASIDYALPDHVENLTLQGSAVTGRGNAAANSIAGNAGANYLAGGAGADSLSGGQGEDVLQGGDGDDALSAAGGANLLDGGAGADVLSGGTRSDLLIGGRGNDALRPRDGANLLAFNRGDGQDTLYSVGGATNALSLGGGIAYEDVKLQKSSNHLVIHLGNGEKITLNGWYQDPNLQTLAQLQFIAEAMAGFDPGGGDPLRDEAIERFDFRPIAAAYDAARAGGYTGQWAIMDALLAAHLAGSDDEALGGDLAYRYGMTGSLSEIGLAAAHSILAGPGFGASPQVLRPIAELGADPVRLTG